MTNETRELLYNKTADQITKKERNYLDRIWLRDYNILNTKVSFMVPILAVLLSNILIPFIIPPFSLTIAISSGIIGLVLSVLLGGAIYTSAPSLKSLGLTRKEWKELKKSKRIKKIKEIVKEFDNHRRLEIIQANNRLGEIVLDKSTSKYLDKITSKYIDKLINLDANVESTDQVQENNLSLILKLTEKLSTEEKSTLITKLINEKDATAESETTDDRVEETPREKDYLESALEACLEFNDKLDRDTFDN